MFSHSTLTGNEQVELIFRNLTLFNSLTVVKAGFILMVNFY